MIRDISERDSDIVYWSKQRKISCVNFIMNKQVFYNTSTYAFHKSVFVNKYILKWQFILFIKYIYNVKILKVW